ncbi:hypothetical protein [Parasitella parasitica]|uniref:Restriction of telomere capping protein 4 n=1 Tax=Parasitella parasitica TaxID=35722 RepID=A0A0B7N0G3_9FUNG|nr:hypothetical protein [Parasitella parasitica]
MEQLGKRPLRYASSSDEKRQKPTDIKESSSADNEKQLTIKSARGRKLVLPKRRPPKSEEGTEEKKAISEKTIQEIKTGKIPKSNYFDCPLCGETIHPPYPFRLKRLIKRLEKNQVQFEKEQREEYAKEVVECKKNNMFLMPFIPKTAGISANDKRLICRTHQIELVFKPLGKEKGYPEHIDFDAIANRITLFQDELLGIIERRVPSTYLDDAYSRFEKLGMKARSSKELLMVFQNFKPGYYGVKGSDAIMQALVALYLETSIINLKNVRPLTPIEFIQQILVPESGLRLIRQDHNNKIDLQEAERIMKESEEYGSIVYYKAKKDKKTGEKQKKDKPFEGITFDDPLSMRKADNDEDDNQAEDLLNSQLSTTSQENDI